MINDYFGFAEPPLFIEADNVTHTIPCHDEHDAHVGRQELSSYIVFYMR